MPRGCWTIAAGCTPSRGRPGLVLETYPEAVQQWIRRRGGLSSRLLLLRGRELAAMVPPCR